MPPKPSIIYHLCPRADWEAGAPGGYQGSPQARADGFLHFSTAAQVEESCAKHCGHIPDLILLAVEAAPLGDNLRWEISRGGEEFPHLYGPLPRHCVIWAKPLPWDGNGKRSFPPLEA